MKTKIINNLEWQMENHKDSYDCAYMGSDGILIPEGWRLPTFEEFARDWGSAGVYPSGPDFGYFISGLETAYVSAEYIPVRRKYDGDVYKVRLVRDLPDQCPNYDEPEQPQDSLTATQEDNGTVLRAIKQPENPQSILLEAQKIVNGDRAADYGDSNQGFKNIALQAGLLGVEIDAIGVAKVLMSVKMVREGFKHKRDNLVDLCGYAELLQRLYEEGKK